ncbi:MAG TPA: hypothetical protein VH761_00655, partial [Ilumatobacteraceae bacterium]
DVGGIIPPLRAAAGIGRTTAIVDRVRALNAAVGLATAWYRTWKSDIASRTTGVEERHSEVHGGSAVGAFTDAR